MIYLFQLAQLGYAKHCCVEIQWFAVRCERFACYLELVDAVSVFSYVLQKTSQAHKEG